MKAIVKIVLILTLMALLFVMVRCTSMAERQTEPAGSPPVITHSFAAEKLSHGDIWKIYVKANDPDGDMRRIVYSISKGGVWAWLQIFRHQEGQPGRAVRISRLFLQFPSYRGGRMDGAYADLVHSG